MSNKYQWQMSNTPPVVPLVIASHSPKRPRPEEIGEGVAISETNS